MLHNIDLYHFTFDIVLVDLYIIFKLQHVCFPLFNKFSWFCRVCQFITIFDSCVLKHSFHKMNAFGRLFVNIYASLLLIRFVNEFHFERAWVITRMQGLQGAIHRKRKWISTEITAAMYGINKREALTNTYTAIILINQLI